MDNLRLMFDFGMRRDYGKFGVNNQQRRFGDFNLCIRDQVLRFPNVTIKSKFRACFISVIKDLVTCCFGLFRGLSGVGNHLIEFAIDGVDGQRQAIHHYDSRPQIGVHNTSAVTPQRQITSKMPRILYSPCIVIVFAKSEC